MAFVNAYRFPGNVRQRFAFRYENLRTDQIDQVEAAARQWFRLIAGHPREHLSMPSTVAGDLVREFTVQTVEYAAFCDCAFGHPPRPERDGGSLGRTFHLAQRDEGSAPSVLPLIFGVDRELGVEGGRHYLAACGGGRTVCHGIPGATCLQHLGGVRRSKLPFDTRPGGPPPPPIVGDFIGGGT